MSLLIIALGGCKGTQSPSVTVVSAQLGQSTEYAATVNLWLHLENPNDEPLELLEFDYDVDVDGKQVYQGKRSAQMTLAQLSTRDVQIPAVIPFDKIALPGGGGAMLEGSEVRVKGTLRYVLPGALAQTLFDTGARRPRVSFRGKKLIEAANVPTTAPATSQP